jgi:hypothetical protein
MRPVSTPQASVSIITASEIIDGNVVIGCKEAGTLWVHFCERVRRTRDRIAYRDYDWVANGWRDHTWRGGRAGQSA